MFPKVDVVEDLPKKNLKTVELVECPNCHKKLTERTLKYSHNAVCSAVNPPQPKPKVKAEATAQAEEQQKTIQHVPLSDAVHLIPPVTARMQRINIRAERYKKLVANAF